MNETIFDIKEPLPINIVIVPSNRNVEIVKGTIDKIILDVKLYLFNNSTTNNEQLLDIPINTKGILVTVDKEYLILVNFMQTFIVTVSSLFVTGYFNGIKLEHFSNN